MTKILCNNCHEEIKVITAIKGNCHCSEWWRHIVGGIWYYAQPLNDSKD